MFTFGSNFSSSVKLPLKTYSVHLPMDKLSPGVDNIHFDVYLSPAFCLSVGKLVHQLFLKHAKMKNVLDMGDTSSLVYERDEFKHHCGDVLRAAVNQAKSASEIQIDLLAQIAIVKKLTKEISVQFNRLLEDLNDIARKHEISSSEGLSGYIRIKEKLSRIQENKKSILLRVASELFRYLIEVQKESIAELRESILGSETVLPDDLFSNPFIHTENPFEDLFMMEKYILIGHRFEDPDSYENLLFLMRKLLRKILLKIFLAAPSPVDGSFDKTKIVHRNHGLSAKYAKDTRYDEIDMWLRHVDNMDLMFNCFKSRSRYKILKKQEAERKELETLKNLEKTKNNYYIFFIRNSKRSALPNESPLFIK